MVKTIFYCSETPPSKDPFQCYLEIEDKLVGEFKNNIDYQLHRIHKPEIYKHPIAFRFLKGFSPDSLHLIIRRPGNIRLLKNAYNVLILPVTIIETEMMPTSENPFTNLKRMFSLVDEIWTTRQENLERLKGLPPPVEYFDDVISLFDKITKYHEDS